MGKRRTNLNTEIASINIVAQEKVSSLGGISAYFEQLHEIIVLPMNISTYCNGRVHLQEVGFSLQDLSTLSEDP